VTLEQHNLIITLLCVPAVVALWFLAGWLRTRSRTGHPWSHHHRQYRWLHHGSLAGIVAALILAATGAGIVYVIVHHGGGVLVPGRHIVPPIHRRGGGPVADGYVSPDLVAYTRPDDASVNQLETLACCGVTTVRLDSLNRAISRGEHVAPLYPLSGYRPWYYATGGQNIGTDPLDDVAALNAHGGEALAYWGPHGHPDSTDPAHTIPLGNASVTWQSYNAGGIGRAGLDDLEWRLDHKQPVGLLWAVHYDGDHAYGLNYTFDSGQFTYFHCLVIVQWARDYPGVGEAVRVWNSYGTGYGQGGLIWLPAIVVERHGNGVFTENPGAAVPAWLPPPPTPTARPRPTARPTSTPRPVPCVPRIGVLKSDANLHATPVLGSPAVAGERAGQRLSTLCPGQPDSTHWTYRSDPTGRQGWLLRSALKTSLK